MRKTIEKIRNQLTFKEYGKLSKENKIRYNENYILFLLEKNKKRGLTLKEANKTIPHLSKPTVLKFLERLIAKRQIFKVHRDKLIIYYPNHRPLHPLLNKRVRLNSKDYNLQLIDNPEGLLLFIQEINRDILGIEEILGGIMIPFTSINKIINILEEIKDNQFKLIEDFKKQKLEEIDESLKVVEEV